MVEKRKRVSASSGTPTSPSKKKIIVSPQYKKLSTCTLRRIRKTVPKGVAITKMEIQVQPSREMKQDIEAKLGELRNEHKLGILIGIIHEGHRNHAISIYRWGDFIYCFDSHGKLRNKASDVIFGIVKDIMGCEILKNYRKLSGMSVLLNTSFNLHGYPIVNSPFDAVNVFLNSGIDGLALNNFIVLRKQV